MFLKKKNVSDFKTNVNVCFENVADDLVMVSLANLLELEGIPSYWRLTGNVGIPPLEIGVDCQHGFITSITFFVDKFAVSTASNLDVSMLEGNVMVDTGIFSKENDYFDVEQLYDVSICGSKLICSFVTKEQYFVAYRNGRVEIYVDSNNCVVGFSICDLSEEEKHLIRQ